MGAETSLQCGPVLSSADVKNETTTVSNTGPSDTVSVEIVVYRFKVSKTGSQIDKVDVEVTVLVLICCGVRGLFLLVLMSHWLSSRRYLASTGGSSGLGGCHSREGFFITTENRIQR